MKLTKNNQSFQVIIPVSIVRAKGWIPGQELDAKITDRGDILLKEK